MKILMVNKFLFQNGGSETYIFKLGKYLSDQGHEVQYFGMDHTERCVGNRVNAYTTEMDFHKCSMLNKIVYLFKTIYSVEARKKIRIVLEDFQPDVVHLNNFNYQLTPSIILEIKKWNKKRENNCRIVFTAHDYQIICPNHMLNNPVTHMNCEKCLGGHYINCVKGKCIHGSAVRSIIGMTEALIWNKAGVYKNIDSIICCSEFLKRKLDSNPVLKDKTVAIHNFIDQTEEHDTEKKDYVLYFGRYAEEKGINTIVEACRMLPDIPFIFAGKGPLKSALNGIHNITDIGYQSNVILDTYIREARITVCPSVWYENCPFSIMESQVRGTPVIGSNLGGIPELITDGQDGNLFECNNAEELAGIIKHLWNSPEILAVYTDNCIRIHRDGLQEYSDKMLKIFGGGVKVRRKPISASDYQSQFHPYVLYFGRFSEEKGMKTLMKACCSLSNIQFVIAGAGPLDEIFENIPNVINVGFQKDAELTDLIKGAKFCIYPSEWYEPYGLSVLESICAGVPVLGADIGGIPEIVEDGVNGELFESANTMDLIERIQKLWSSGDLITLYSQNCKKFQGESIRSYYNRLMNIYTDKLGKNNENINY